MNILNANQHNIVSFVKHFRCDSFLRDGKDVVMFNAFECDGCGELHQGGNPINIKNANWITDERLESLGLVKRQDAEELGCNDDGDALCPRCYNAAEKAARA